MMVHIPLGRCLYHLIWFLLTDTLIYVMFLKL